MKKTSMPNPVNCYSLSRPRPVKSPCNSIRYNCKICSWLRRPKTILEIKEGHISLGDQRLLFPSFSKTLLTTERRLTEQQFLAVDLFPTFLNTGTTYETFQRSGKQDSFRHLLQSSASMYESSGSQFFRTTTGIQSGPDDFDKSRLVITFLTILGVTEILCSFRLILEGKTGKEIPQSSRLEFLEKFSANNFALSDAEGNTSRLLNRGGIEDLPLLRTLLAICQKSQEPSFWKLMDSFVLLAYSSLAASRTLLQQLLARLNFTLASENLSFWYKQKKWIL